jgi:hypothetical protein
MKTNLAESTAEELREPTMEELRGELSVAIAEAAAAQQALEAGRAAVDRAASFVTEAKSRGEAAAVGVAGAQARFVERAAAAARDDATPVGISLRTARAAEADAADEVAACTAAHGDLRAALPSLEEESRVCAHRVVTAANRILAAALIPLLASAEALRIRLIEQLAVIRLLTQSDPADERRRRFSRGISMREMNADDARTAALAEAKDSAERLVSALLGNLDSINNSGDWMRAPGIEAWSKAREQLLTAADTPLPPT